MNDGGISPGGYALPPGSFFLSFSLSLSLCIVYIYIYRYILLYKNVTFTVPVSGSPLPNTLT